MSEVYHSKAGSDKQIQALVNLSDYMNGAENNRYTHSLLQKSIQYRSGYGKRVALTALLRSMINSEQKDSLDYYKKQIKSLLPLQTSDYLINYAELMEQTVALTKGDTSLSRKIIEENQKKIQDIKARHTSFTTNQQIVLLLVLGRGYLSQMMVKKTPKDRNEAIKCFLEALHLAETLPMSETIMFREQALIFMCDIIGTSKGSSVYAKKLLDLENKKGKLPEFSQRPYAERSKLVKAYATLACSPDVSVKDSKKYFDLFRQCLMKYMPDDANRKVNLYSFSLNYYIRLNKPAKALLFCDSLINVMQNRPSQLPNILYVKSDLLTALNRFKEANEVLHLYVDKSDSLQKSFQMEALNEVQTQLKVNRLELDNARLSISHERGRKLTFMSGIVLLFVLVLGIFLYLHKTRKLYHLLQKSYSKLSIEKNKANESERMKSSFIQLICSEVKIPLNVTNELLQLLERTDLSTEQRIEIRGEISKNLRMLSSEIDNMLQISKLDSSEENFDIEDADIYALCYQCLMKVRNEVHKSNILFLSNIKAGTRMPVNRFYFTYLMENLLENAANFSKEGEITINCDSDANYYFLYVADNGIGIPVDKQEYVFDRFAKINPCTPGTGVGLYLCRLIMNRMNGSIYIDSDYKEGTRVVIKIKK